MTEKEKAAAGFLYLADQDEQLRKERLKCKKLCWKYNHLKPKAIKKRKKLLKKILGHVEGKIWVEQDFWCDYGYNIAVGKDFYANHHLVILDGAEVKFGNHVFIGPNCGFYTAGHPMDAQRRHEGLETANPILVGDNVWCGGNVCVLPGVTIGSNSVIAAGSVVTHDIPSDVLAAGNPCRVIRKITEKVEF